MAQPQLPRGTPVSSRKCRRKGKCTLIVDILADKSNAREQAVYPSSGVFARAVSGEPLRQKPREYIGHVSFANFLKACFLGWWLFR